MASEPIAPKTPSLAAQVARAVVWNTLFAPLRLVTEVVATLAKLTVLSQASFGLLSIISATNNGLGTWIDLGTGRALPKYIPEAVHSGGPRATKRLLLAVLGAQICVLAVVGLGFVGLRDIYLDDLRDKITGIERITPQEQQALLGFVGQHGWLLIATVIALLLLGIFYDVLMAYLSSFFKQRAWNSVALVAQMLPQLLIIAVIAISGDIAWLLVAMVAAPSVAVALATWQMLRHQREIADLPQPDDDQRLLPPGFIRYCSVAFFMNATDFIASAGFAVFFTNSLVDAAVLMAGVNIVRMVLSYLYTPMVGVQVPLFTRVRQGEGGTLLGAYQSLIRLQTILLIPGGVGLLILAQPVFATLLPKYAEAAALVWVLVPCLFAESLLTTAYNALVVYERLRTLVLSRVLSLISVPLVLLLSPTLGIVGVALGFGVARVAAGLWVTVSGYRLLGLRWPWQFTLRVVAASVAMALVVGGLSILLPPVPAGAGVVERLLTLPLLLGVAMVGAVGLLGALRLLGGLDPQDRQQLARMRLPLKKWVLKIL